MGPRMDPKIIALWTEKFHSAISRGSQCRAGLNDSSSSAPAAAALPPSAGCPERAARLAPRSAPSSPTSWCGSDRSPRCAGAFQVRSILLRGVGTCSWWANQARDGAAGQSDLGKKTSLSLCSAAASSSPRAASSLATGSQLASESRAASARSATPTSLSRASRSRTRARCTRSMARCLPNESQSESNQRHSGEPGPGTRNVRAIGVVSRPVTGRSVTATSERMDATGGESAATIFLQGRAARSAHVAHNHKVVSSNLTPATSSGDGLGIQQPGSMTRGFASRRQPPSGRARDRAICPAVARSFLAFVRRAA